MQLNDLQPQYLFEAEGMTSVYSRDYQVVIKALRDGRIASGVTQETLASALGRPQSFVAKVESGERRIDVVEFIHICRLLKIEPNSILKLIL